MANLPVRTTSAFRKVTNEWSASRRLLPSPASCRGTSERRERLPRAVAPRPSLEPWPPRKRKSRSTSALTVEHAENHAGNDRFRWRRTATKAQHWGPPSGTFLEGYYVSIGLPYSWQAGVAYLPAISCRYLPKQPCQIAAPHAVFWHNDEGEHICRLPSLMHEY